MAAQKPVIALTQGDPAGVGPELCLKAIGHEEVLSICAPVVIGDRTVLEQVAAQLKLAMPPKTISRREFLSLGSSHILTEPVVVDCGAIREGVVPGRLSPECGMASYKYLLTAIEATQKGICDAITTAPLNKSALHMADVKENGHTEILAAETGTRDFAMMLFSDKLALGFVTCHEALSAVPKVLSRKRIETVTRLTAETLVKLQGKPPKLVVLGLNPHSGEDGAFGREEIEIIAPAVVTCRDEGIDVEGPIPADAGFMPHNMEKYDGFICQYHDQGHIPFKMISLHDGANITMGLPIIRTSVDHGTAFDIAWEGTAETGSITAAIRFAVRLIQASGIELLRSVA